jgi:hypothetical protein
MNLRLLSAKDIQKELYCSRSLSYKIYKELKMDNPEAKRLTYEHLYRYLGLIKSLQNTI